MLQPSQLQEISVKFPAEIADVRAFLLRAGVPVDTRDAFRDMVQRLRKDPTFHRDLGSHAWILLYAGAGVPEVLQVFAVAAAGVRNGAVAEEDDAHAVLGFVLEERRALLAGSRGKQTSAVAAAEAPLPPVMRETVTNVALKPADPEPSKAEEPRPDRARASARVETASEPDPPVAMVRSRRSKIATWLVTIGACLVGTVFGGVWIYREVHDVEPSWTTSVEGYTPAPVVTSSPPSSALVPSTGTKYRTGSVGRKPAASANGTVSGTATVDARNADAMTPTATAPGPATPNSAAAPIVRVPSGSPAPVSRTAPLIPSGVVAGKAPAPPVPTAVLSSRLGSPSANAADAVDDRVAGTKGYPHLLRRKSLLPNGTLVADSAGPASSGGAKPTAVSIPRGTVRSTSLGISAGNLVYAPDPAYPASAAQQHVAGQVTVQAVVDRDGNVASARVVSGPPLLREAAVDAVQRWRFRPFLSGGKPQAFTATAVVDFQLQ